MNPDKQILIVPPDVDTAALGAYVLDGGPMPDRCRLESLEEWMERGRVADCDCGLMQCACSTIRPHQPKCAFRLSITSPIDVGPMPCTCGATR